MLEASLSLLSTHVPRGRKGLRVKSLSATSSWSRVREGIFVHTQQLVPRPVCRRGWGSSKDSFSERADALPRDLTSRVTWWAWMHGLSPHWSEGPLPQLCLWVLWNSHVSSGGSSSHFTFLYSKGYAVSLVIIPFWLNADVEHWLKPIALQTTHALNLDMWPSVLVGSKEQQLSHFSLLFVNLPKPIACSSCIWSREILRWWACKSFNSRGCHSIHQNANRVSWNFMDYGVNGAPHAAEGQIVVPPFSLVVHCTLN